MTLQVYWMVFTIENCTSIKCICSISFQLYKQFSYVTEGLSSHIVSICIRILSLIKRKLFNRLFVHLLVYFSRYHKIRLIINRKFQFQIIYRACTIYILINTVKITNIHIYTHEKQASETFSFPVTTDTHK